MTEYTLEEKYEWMQERIAIAIIDGRLDLRNAEKQAIEDWYKFINSFV